MQQDYRDFMPYLGFVIKMKIEEIQFFYPGFEEVDNNLPFPNQDYDRKVYFPNTVELIFDNNRYYFTNPQNDDLADYNGYKMLRGILEQFRGIFYGTPLDGEMKLVSKNNNDEEYQREVPIEKDELEPLLKLEKMLGLDIIPWGKNDENKINQSWINKYEFQSENGRKYLHWMNISIDNLIFTHEVSYIRQEDLQVPCKIITTTLVDGSICRSSYSFTDHKINKKEL